MEQTFRIKVGGEYACFSRPEFKVERVSYPVITPSAARGVLEAIFWKPEFRWEIREIHVLKLGHQMSILRNELSDRQGRWPVFVEDERQQRASLILKDVEYVLCAQMSLQPHATDPPAKYTEQFQRRLERGQCHHMPYLGTREFSAWFEPARDDDRPAKLNLHIGKMLFDIAYREDEKRQELSFYRQDGNGRRVVKGYAQPLFFEASVVDGVLRVPREKYLELYRLEDRYAK